MPGLAPHKRILTANQRQTIIARGTTLFLRQATGELSVTVRSNQVGTKTGASYTLRMEQAEKWFHAEEFDEVVVVDESGAENAIELYIGFGDFQKPVPDIINVAFSVPAARSIITRVDHVNIDIGAAGKELIAAENLSRTKIIITALAAKTDAIRVGDANVDTDRGTPLLAGETIAFDNTAAVYACSETANNQGAAHTESEV